MIERTLVALGLLAGLLVETSVDGAALAETRVRKFLDPVSQSWLSFRVTVAVTREIVNYDGPYEADTIIIETSERRLYYTLGDGKAVRYGVGVGREGFQWAGTDRISRKAEWPSWTPPKVMIARDPKAAKWASGMPGGPDNPLGARAMYIGSTIYRIHGSSEPWTIGDTVSSGCIRMTNEDVIDLYERVKVGTKVVVRS